MQLKRLNLSRWIAVVTVFWSLIAISQSQATEPSSEAIVARGNDFVLTQAQVDSYMDVFKPMKLNWTREGSIKTALKYELLSREYRKSLETSADGKDIAKDIAIDHESVSSKIQDGQKYIQIVLDGWKVPDPVIESYYRANPEKYYTGQSSDEKIVIRPMDDVIKNDIRFLVIEKKKESITRELVDLLIAQYNIEIK